MSGRIGAAGAALLTSLLVDCSGQDPAPSEPPPLPSTATTSNQPPATTPPPPTTTEPSGAPVLPDAAKAHTPAGAEAFVRHWYDTLQYSWDIMDSAPIRALGSCLSCNNFADTIDSVNADGNRLVGGAVTIRGTDASTILSDGSTTVIAPVDFAEQRIASPDGSEQTFGPATPKVQTYFELGWASGDWIVSEIRIIE